jgi:putative sigma-54 modulation protein
MQLIIKGKNLEVTDWLRTYVEKKMGKLDRYLPTIDEVRVELSEQKTRSAKHRQVAQVTVRSNGVILRAEERTDDMFASIDAVLDKIYRQIARYKGKRFDRYRGQSEPLPIEEVTLEAEEGNVVRTKNFRLTPMDEEEAIEQMELLGHDFFVFYNVSNQNINVLYRRKDGDYGLLNPQME